MPRSRKKKSRKKKKRKARPYKLDKHTRARRAYRKRRHRSSRITGHHARHTKEAEYTNFLLKALLKTASSTEDRPYNYHPRHFTKDPEYNWETSERQEFKRGFPAPDVSMLRPQADDLPPHWGNYPIPAIAHRR